MWFLLNPPPPLLPIFASFIFHLRTARHCNIIPIISDRSLRDATHLRRNSPLFFRRISHTYTSFFYHLLRATSFYYINLVWTINIVWEAISFILHV